MDLYTQLQTSLGDNYTLERELGGGGMARVFVATEVGLGRKVVVKVLPPVMSSVMLSARFRREISLAAQLRHPHIVPLFAAGDAGGLLYYTMPFVEGESLRARLLRTEAIPVSEGLRLIREIAYALSYAHSHGVVHRDIKPENILVHGGHAVVADFGIGKALSAATENASLTQIGIAIGTPAYMSPEQAAGDDSIDGRSDLYSLGCVLYELLTGEPPFTGPSLQAVIAKRFTTTPPEVTRSRPSVPDRMAKAVARLLAREPDDRYGTGAEFVAALRAPTAPSSGSETRARSDLSIAVLPFANMSADQEAEYFSDGMTEEILNALAKLSGLRVMSRTSSFAFKGKNIDIRAIGEQLGARYVLEGSVRKSGERLRITISGPSGTIATCAMYSPCRTRSPRQFAMR
jgi:eukaryotic-like serine/threonine-protein kinase